MYVINRSVPHCAAVLTVPQCVPVSSLSADHICSQLQKPPLQAPDWFTKSVWRIVLEVFPRDSAFSLCLLSSGLFQKSLPSSLVYSSQLPPLLEMLLNLLPSFLPSGVPFPPRRFNSLSFKSLTSNGSRRVSQHHLASVDTF